MPKTIWNGVTLAESNEGEVVEGNYYLLLQSIKRALPTEHDAYDLSLERGSELLRHCGG